MSEKENMINDNANVLDNDYDDEETGRSEEDLSQMQDEENAKDLAAMDGEKMPEVKAVETADAVEPKQSVQLSMDPSIQIDEEKNEAAQDHKKKNEAILEGLLFLTGDDGLTLAQASETMDLKKSEVEELLDELQKYYVSDERGFEIERFGETYRFLSKACVHSYAKKLFQINNEAKLSNAAMETLAIIAYKQPITRVEIEEIRGVGADVMLHKLEARGLIKEDGRSDAPGRPILYSVTDEFMDAFKLMSLEELPELPKFGDGQEESDDLFKQ
jgi:segregation and condensation protein B